MQTLLNSGLGRRVALWLALVALAAAAPVAALAAPFAAVVMDARTGEIIHARNHDTRLHPASLTKMMTLYIAFEAIRNGEITLDTPVRISANAAGSPCSCLGLRAGQTIALRYLLRAAAVRSANDAATAIGEAISGSEPAFIERMNRTARALGMTNTTFRNAHGLTAPGHLSSARDMTILGRQLYFDYPEYWNLWSRRSADAGIAQVVNTNRHFLNDYRGADGIKTGFTRAAGFNLTASAERDGRRIIVTVFGGQSVPDRTRRVVELMDLGFARAPARVAVRRPPPPNYGGQPPRGPGVAMAQAGAEPARAARVAGGAVARSPIPPTRPAAAPAEAAFAALQDGIAAALADAGAALPAAAASTAAAAIGAAPPRPAGLAEAPAEAPRPFAVAEAEPAAEAPEPAAPRPFALAEVEAEAGVEDDATSALAVASAPLPPARPDDLAGAEDADIAPEAVPLSLAAAQGGVEPMLGSLVPIDVAAAAAAARPAPPPLAQAAAAPLVVLTFTPPAAAGEEPVRLAALTEAGKAEPAAPAAPAAETAAAEVIDRQLSTAEPRLWGVSIGRFGSRDAAERALMRVALGELANFDGALRRVQPRTGAFEATLVGMTRAQAQSACDRLQARARDCTLLAP